MSTNWADRRQTSRQRVAGKVLLTLEGPAPVEIQGQLVDVSLHGFRASHNYPTLHSGAELQFRHPLASGRARVVWNRIAGQQVESGFLILSQ